MKARKALVTAVAFAGMLGVGATRAQADPNFQTALDSHAAFTLSASNGTLTCVDFQGGSHRSVGAVQLDDGTTLTNIRAVAYFPNFQNLFAFWVSPTDGKNKLVYVNVTDGAGTVVDEDVEGGLFTGAVALNSVAHPWKVFGIQNALIKPPSPIQGKININPNNSQTNEFSFTIGSGQTFTRDDLLAVNSLPSSGTYYQGPAPLIHVKPKGNGNQNGLMIDGEVYQLQNSNTYDFSGEMQIRVYNDKVKGNGTPMGHWWIDVISGTTIINNEVEVLSPNRICTVDQETGTVTEIMTLNREYVGLATNNGTTFYTTNGNNLYKIDTTAMTETLVGPLGSNVSPSALSFVDNFLSVYENQGGDLNPVNPANGQSAGTGQDSGVGGVSTLVIVPANQFPTSSAMYD